MTRPQLERLADPQRKESNVKTSRRDLSVVLSQVIFIVHVWCRVKVWTMKEGLVTGTRLLTGH